MCENCRKDTHRAKMFSAHVFEPIEARFTANITCCMLSNGWRDNNSLAMLFFAAKHTRPLEIFCTRHCELLCITCFLASEHNQHHSECLQLDDAEARVRSLLVSFHDVWSHLFYLNCNNKAYHHNRTRHLASTRPSSASLSSKRSPPRQQPHLVYADLYMWLLLIA